MQVYFVSFTEQATPRDGVAFERPEETSWMLDLSRYLQGTQNYIMSTHILLSVFGESCKSQPQTRKVPLSRVSSPNRSARREPLRYFTDQFFPQQFAWSPCRSTLWRWKWNDLFPMQEKQLSDVLLLWLCTVSVPRLLQRTRNAERAVRRTQSHASEGF